MADRDDKKPGAPSGAADEQDDLFNEGVLLNSLRPEDYQHEWARALNTHIHLIFRGLRANRAAAKIVQEGAAEGARLQQLLAITTEQIPTIVELVDKALNVRVEALADRFNEKVNANHRANLGELQGARATLESVNKMLLANLRGIKDHQEALKDMRDANREEAAMEHKMLKDERAAVAAERATLAEEQRRQRPLWRRIVGPA